MLRFHAERRAVYKRSEQTSLNVSNLKRSIRSRESGINCEDSLKHL